MEKTFEEALNELEKIASELENGELTLDESMKKFEDGMKMSQYCTDILDKAEKKITTILDKNSEIVEENME